MAVGQDGSIDREVSRSLAHRAPGILHLAVSLQVVDPDGQWLLQRRATSKATFPGRWANSCCTHPSAGEAPVAAGIRRISEELALLVDDLIPAGAFTYRAVDEQSGLVEYEQDHVFVAVAPTHDACGSPSEVSQLARVPYDFALALVRSDEGAPWAAEVLERSFEALHHSRALT